jgi:hypothetical protein
MTNLVTTSTAPDSARKSEWSERSLGGSSIVPCVFSAFPIKSGGGRCETTNPSGRTQLYAVIDPISSLAAPLS